MPPSPVIRSDANALSVSRPFRCIFSTSVAPTSSAVDSWLKPASKLNGRMLRMRSSLVFSTVLGDTLRTGHQVAVRQHHALRQSRRARRVDDGRDVAIDPPHGPIELAAAVADARSSVVNPARSSGSGSGVPHASSVFSSGQARERAAKAPQARV